MMTRQELASKLGIPESTIALTDIKIGTVFDTTFEKGCVIKSMPDENGQFIGTDSDGVEYIFSVTMITSILGIK